jgi:hypothetical protein
VPGAIAGSYHFTSAMAVQLLKSIQPQLEPLLSSPPTGAALAPPLVGTDDDIVGRGLVPSLARPGGNLTGISFMATELDGKRLEILMGAGARLPPYGRTCRSDLDGAASARGSPRRCRVA